MTMRDKVARSLSTLEAQNARMRVALWRSVAQGRWAAATPAERWHTRRNFQINLKRRRELVSWLAAQIEENP